ncbi:hypothetical protein [Acinetobacter guerrae]|uniref:hypothetical protein n=1 Tax=Acinetobacter guerrae TaxID=1843371 RepID=UPI00128E5789|nr:hypothetical protein [Acinetobacter guerrae]MPW44199.1 hypothetical protein [Acinetobacter guerrae]
MFYLKNSAVGLSITQQRLLLVLFLSIGLSACEQHSSERDISTHDREATSSLSQDLSHNTDDEQGSKLVDIAGQATLPIETNSAEKKSTLLSDEALKYAGRYHAHIRCIDPFARCDRKHGEIDYIVNLLDDGSAYRQRVSLGRLKVDDSQSTKSYRHDNWTMNKNETQHEVVVSVAAGGDLYFIAKDQNHLQMNLAKTLNTENGQNRKQLGDNFILPQQAYILTRIYDTEISNQP